MVHFDFVHPCGPAEQPGEAAGLRRRGAHFTVTSAVVAALIAELPESVAVIVNV